MFDFDIGRFLLQIVILLFSLSIHESAHAWTAERFGDYTGRALGRVSLNPLAHIDPIGTVLFPVLAFLTRIPLIGWAKPVPINPLNLNNPRRDQIFISAAGPVSNILAGIGFLILLKLLVGLFGYEILVGTTMLTPLALLCLEGTFLNFLLAVFNLIPIPPLDGHWVLYGVLPAHMADAFDRIRPYGFILLLLLFYTGALGVILGPVYSLIYRWILL